MHARQTSTAQHNLFLNPPLQEALDDLSGSSTSSAQVLCYLCGPPGMVVEVRRHLEEALGADRAARDVFYELWE